MEIQTYKDNIREYTQHSTTNNNVIITTIMPGTHYWQAFFTKQQTREPWQRMPCGMGPGKKWTYTTVWEYKNVKTIYENTLNINVTAPTWEGDLNCSKWGPDFEWNGDQKGAFGNKKRGPKMRIFDMNSFQNVFSACVDEQLLESGGKRKAEGRLQLVYLDY